MLLAFSVAQGIAGCAQPTPPKAIPDRNALLRNIAAKADEDYPGLTTEQPFRAALAAIATLDRAQFVPPGQRAAAYVDLPLEIGFGQTISDPYVVAVMTAAVGAAPGMHILEIGTGSGYQAAVLARIGARVHSIEIVPELAHAAAARLADLGFTGVSVRAGDGFLGWPDQAPFDAIIVTAGAATVPPPLLAQLRPGSKLVMPLGASTEMEQLVVITKDAVGATSRCSLGPAMFVPLTGIGRTPDRVGIYDRSIPLCRPGQQARWPGQAPG